MKLRVFVIDQDECILDTLRMHLESQGHEVVTAASPTACAAFHGHDCQNDFPCGHALLINYYASGMNALDYLEIMETKGCKGAMRNKIIMSGYSPGIDMQRADRLGCTVLQKPVTLGTIDQLINRIAAEVDTDAPLADLLKLLPQS